MTIVDVLIDSLECFMNLWEFSLSVSPQLSLGENLALFEKAIASNMAFTELPDRLS